jgi:hypothetical protein
MLERKIIRSLAAIYPDMAGLCRLCAAPPVNGRDKQHLYNSCPWWAAHCWANQHPITAVELLHDGDAAGAIRILLDAMERYPVLYGEGLDVPQPSLENLAVVPPGLPIVEAEPILWSLIYGGHPVLSGEQAQKLERWLVARRLHGGLPCGDSADHFAGAAAGDQSEDAQGSAQPGCARCGSPLLLAGPLGLWRSVGSESLG